MCLCWRSLHHLWQVCVEEGGRQAVAVVPGLPCAVREGGSVVVPGLPCAVREGGSGSCAWPAPLCSAATLAVHVPVYMSNMVTGSGLSW